MGQQSQEVPQFSRRVGVGSSGVIEFFQHQLAEAPPETVHLNLQRAFRDVQPPGDLPIRRIAVTPQQQIAALGIHALPPRDPDILLQTVQRLLNETPGPLLLEDPFGGQLVMRFELIPVLDGPMVQRQECLASPAFLRLLAVPLVRQEVPCARKQEGAKRPRSRRA